MNFLKTTIKPLANTFYVNKLHGLLAYFLFWHGGGVGVEAFSIEIFYLRNYSNLMKTKIQSREPLKINPDFGWGSNLPYYFFLIWQCVVSGTIPTYPKRKKSKLKSSNFSKMINFLN